MNQSGGAVDATALGKEVGEKVEQHQQPLSGSEKEFSMSKPTGEKERIETRNISSSHSSSTSGENDNLGKLDSKIVKLRDSLEGDAAYAHLPEHERQIIKRQLDIPEVKVNFKTLFRYSTRNDLIFLVISSFCAIAGGAVLPLMTIIFGNLAGTFQDYLFLGRITRHKFDANISRLTVYFIYLAIGEFVTIYVATVGFIYVGEHVTQKIRERYLRSILRQNIAFFDKLGAGEVTTRITADTNLIQDGISEKVGLTLTAVATFITAFVIAYAVYWKLALICSSAIVALMAVMGGGSSFIVKFSKNSIQAYALGGTVAEEVISSIRNATAFGTQDKLAKQYDKHLTEAERWGFKLKVVLGFFIGGMMGVIFLNYGLCFWMGSRFLVDGSMTLSNVLTVLLCIIIGAFNLGNVAPNVQAFTSGVAAGAKIFGTIDRASPIDPLSDEGVKLDTVEGTVELKEIKHIYPSRAEVVVMKNINLLVPAGKTTALVGASGSGKSTIVGLVERFYDPVGGTLYLDGHDMRTLNLRWLRQHISLVQQEPVLFGTTIYQNIKFGLIGTRFEQEPEEKQKELIESAARMANAHDFVSSLPEGYETNVGERGFLLSGGQKQRIAIARAVVSDPKILLLDEATSALDTKSEGVVQAALDAAAKGRTTIVIAHRLSTIKHADNIVVMSEGEIIEQGTHDELLERRQAYFRLVEAQKIGEDKEEAESEENGEKYTSIEKEELIRTQTGKSGRSASIPYDPEDEKLANKLNRTQTEKSVSSKILADQKPEGGANYSLGTLIMVIARFNKKEWHLMLIGLIFSILAGGGQPTQAVFFSKSISALSRPPSQYGQLKHDVRFWALMYLMLGLVQLLVLIIQGLSFAYCSERLIHRARDRAFRTMLRQDITYFDMESHSTGALTSFLSTEATHLAGISGSTLGTILMVSTTLFASMIISLVIGWKLALVCISCVPILLGCGYFRFYMLSAFHSRAKDAYESSASFACESTSAIRTVASLTREEDVWDQYNVQLIKQGKASLRSVLKSSTLYASSQALTFLCIALAFWYGGKLLGEHEYTLFQFFLIFSEIIFGAQSAGTVFSFAPDMGKAKSAAKDLKVLFDRKPAIDTWSTDGEKVESVEGLIEFRDVHFRYPTRPEQPVLRGLNLTVSPGQYIALVGASGCGKSTTIAMMERFYDPLSGAVYVDGKDISTLNVNEYRRHLALVSQEPTLYQGTIKENVLLGADRDDVSDEAVIQACKSANIYDFIISLPDGFGTVVGSKGSMLSGGQKQRIAIARALIRNPKILLLDEATSALDSESEKVVQAALDAAAEGRTTIAVAHRLSTIQKADIIYVFDQGKIVESGTHHELLKNKGRYFELVNLQSLGKVG